jgi:glutamine synthetase
MSEAELSSRKIGYLPTTIAEAIEAFEKDAVIREGLGTAFSDEYIKVKREEWRQYNQSVHPWELDRYLGTF